jgi:hypothetical protein
MTPNLDGLSSGAWRPQPRKLSAEKPLQHPLPVKPPLPARTPRPSSPLLPVNLTLPARASKTFRAKPKAGRNSNGGVPTFDAQVNHSNNSSESIGATHPNHRRDHSGVRAHEEYKKEDAGPKHSTVSNESNAQVSEHPSPLRSENEISQRSASSLTAIGTESYN